jgi:hypothetical protein
MFAQYIDNTDKSTPNEHDLIGVELSGEDFNEFYKEPLVKLTNRKCIQKGYHFVYGLNEDFNKFCAMPNTAGGLHFTTKENVGKWLLCDDTMHMYYIWNVEIPSDARVYIEKDKFKADKIILKRKIAIFESDDYMLFLSKNGLGLKLLPNSLITKEICDICVNQNGLALQYVPNEFKTYDLCHMALKNNSFALRYIPKEYKHEEELQKRIALILEDFPMMIKYSL